MSSTEVRAAGSAEAAELSTIDMALEVVTVPVADVDRAKRFYQSLGWRLDIDLVIDDDHRTNWLDRWADAADHERFSSSGRPARALAASR